MIMIINYIVEIHDWHGTRKIECETINETWEAIGSRAFGGLYNVGSPTGKDVSEFIPF